MKFSYHLPVERVKSPDQFLTGQAVVEMTRALEKAGIDAVYVTDHPAPADSWLATGGHHTLDPFVALSFAAAATTTLKLHANIVVIPYRNPFLTAKSIASLDRLSGGRVILGIGAGYLEGEFKALGAPFSERGAVMDESIEVMKRIWTGQSVRFEGTYFQADGNTALPVPLQHPHPPIWVGGNTDKAIRRAVATCDGWSPFPVSGGFGAHVRTDTIASVDDLKRKIDQARALAQRIGRTQPLDVCMTPFALTMQNRVRPEAAAICDGLAALAQAGVTWTAIALPCRDRSHYLENVDWFGREVIAVMRGTPAQRPT